MAQGVKVAHPQVRQSIRGQYYTDYKHRKNSNGIPFEKFEGNIETNEVKLFSTRMAGMGTIFKIVDEERGPHFHHFVFSGHYGSQCAFTIREDEDGPVFIKPVFSPYFNRIPKLIPGETVLKYYYFGGSSFDLLIPYTWS